MRTALEGVRVLDLGRVWSGPLAGKILADLGAEVINIVGLSAIVGPKQFTPEIAKILGVFPGDEPGERPWNRMSLPNDVGRGKLGLTLELDTDEGREIFKRLVKISHVVLENFSPRVMPNFGLDYPVLREINPGIILCSMPGYGLTGPYRDWVSYGTNLDPASGLASLMGYPGEGPQMLGNAYPDPVASINAVNAVLTALVHVRRTGRGQHIDLSQCESATFAIGETVVGYALNNRVPERLGNRHPFHAPHNSYPCKGEDRWVAISVTSDAQWRALCEAMGDARLADDARFADAIVRWEHQDELDALIRAWTMVRAPGEVMETLQRAGVPAGAVHDAPGLLNDPHLNERGFFVEVEHPEAGRHRYCRLPILLSKTPADSGRPAPCLGQHNEQILGGLLGLSREEIDRLEAEGIIGHAPADTV